VKGGVRVPVYDHGASAAPAENLKSHFPNLKLHTLLALFRSLLTFQNFCQAGKKKRKIKETKASAQEEEYTVSEKSVPEPHFVY
jgi:hypothetical protein